MQNPLRLPIFCWHSSCLHHYVSRVSLPRHPRHSHRCSTTACTPVQGMSTPSDALKLPFDSATCTFIPIRPTSPSLPIWPCPSTDPSSYPTAFQWTFLAVPRPTFAAFCKRSPDSPTQMFRVSFATLMSLMGFPAFLSFCTSTVTMSLMRLRDPYRLNVRRVS